LVLLYYFTYTDDARINKNQVSVSYLSAVTCTMHTHNFTSRMGVSATADRYFKNVPDAFSSTRCSSSEGQPDEAWEPSNKAMLFRRSGGNTSKKSSSSFLRPSWMDWSDESLADAGAAGGQPTETEMWAEASSWSRWKPETRTVLGRLEHLACVHRWNSNSRPVNYKGRKCIDLCSVYTWHMAHCSLLGGPTSDSSGSGCGPSGKNVHEPSGYKQDGHFLSRRTIPTRPRTMLCWNLFKAMAPC